MTLPVAEASRHGATPRIAGAVGRGLPAAGVANDLRSEGSTRLTPTRTSFSAAPCAPGLAGRREGVRRTSWRTDGGGRRGLSTGPTAIPAIPATIRPCSIDESMATTGARRQRVFHDRLDRHRLGSGSGRSCSRYALGGEPSTTGRRSPPGSGDRRRAGCFRVLIR